MTLDVFFLNFGSAISIIYEAVEEKIRGKIRIKYLTKGVCSPKYSKYARGIKLIKDLKLIFLVLISPINIDVAIMVEIGHNIFFRPRP